MYRWSAIVLLVGLAPVAARADDDSSSSAAKMQTTTNGYIDTRFTYIHVVGSSPIPPNDVAGFANLTEANFQLRLSWGDKGMFLADASFIYQYATDFRSATGPLPDQQIAAYQPLAVLNEFYGIYNFTDHLNLTLGKKRVLWGPGFMYNPTDILNPPKDPTNPTFQREGQWMARLEAPYRNWTITLLGAAKTLTEFGGLPSGLLYWPGSDKPTSSDETYEGLYDTAPHFLLAARAYALVADTDINLMYFYSNLFNDEFEHKSRVGASVSRTLGYWELHAEGIFQLGDSSLYANPSCVTSPSAIATCGSSGQTPAGYSQLSSNSFVAQILVGGRYTLNNNGLFSIEYYFNGNGYTPSQYKDYVSLINYGEAASNAGVISPGSFPGLPNPGAAQTGVPQLFSFSPLRRHYLFLEFQQPQIFNDWTVTAALILDCEDLSGIFAPSIQWSATEWLNLTLGGIVGIPGVSQWGANVAGGAITNPITGMTLATVPSGAYTEFGVIPFNWDVYFAVRAYY